MSSHEDYSGLYEKIVSIAGQDLCSPHNIPVDVYIQEAENLYQWAQADREALEARGLAFHLIDELPRRCGALRYAQAAWITSRFTREEARTEWEAKADSAYELRDDLLDELAFAFRKDEELTKRVKAIAEGTGHADMLQDLADLAMLGANNPGPLAAIKFDPARLDTARELADELSALLARAEGEKKEDNGARIIRDQAYSYLKKAVDEIRDYGKFVFRKNEARLKGYGSDYLKKKNRQVKKSRKSKGTGPDQAAGS